MVLKDQKQDAEYVIADILSRYGAGERINTTGLNHPCINRVNCSVQSRKELYNFWRSL